MFILKDYQEKALTALDGFFRQLRMSGLAGAWQECAPLQEKQGQTSQAAYNAEALGDTPAVWRTSCGTLLSIYLSTHFKGGQSAAFAVSAIK